MKKKIGLIGLIGAISMAATSASAQNNFAVRWLASDARHEFNQVPGCPTNWPVAVDRLAAGESNPWPDRAVISAAQLGNLYRTVGPAFTNWHSAAWAAAQRAKMTNEAATAAAKEQAIKDAFTAVENEVATINTNAPSAAELLRVIRRQNDLLARLRPKMEGREGSNLQAPSSKEGQATSPAPPKRPRAPRVVAPKQVK